MMYSKRRSDQQGFTHIILILIIVFVAVCAFAGWRYIEAGNPPVMQAVITNYDECRVAEGSSIVETYPEQCVSKSGEIYVNETQKAPDVNNSAPEQANDLPATTSQAEYDKCSKAEGSKILQTYPEQCVTSDGKTYVHGSQKL